jgi:outer membrane immunogenic protein
MRKLLVATAFAVGTAGLVSTASAADLGQPRRGSIKDAPPPPVAYVQPFSWTGLYVGAQVGYGWGTTDTKFGPLAGFNQTSSYDINGWVGGGHAGYNWQVQNLVFGIETDIEASSIGGSGRGSLGLPHNTDINWIGSTRGRLGIAYDRTLFYGTAGWAYGDVNINRGIANFSDVRSGWTAGAGVEHAISDRMTMRLEYRYTDLGSSSFSNTPLNAIDNSDVTFHTVRAGVSFKF